MSAPRWDAMADWDAHELLDAYGDFRDRYLEELDLGEPHDWSEKRYLLVREEILRRLEGNGA